MNSFNVGDRVEYVARDSSATRKTGETGTVLAASARGFSYKVLWDTDGLTRSHNPSYLKLATTPPPLSKPKPLWVFTDAPIVRSKPEPDAPFARPPVPKPAYLQGKRTVALVPHSKESPILVAALPEWPDYLVETWQHMVNSLKFVSHIRTRVGNQPFEVTLEADFAAVKINMQVQEQGGITVVEVVEQMIANGLKQINGEVEALNLKKQRADNFERETKTRRALEQMIAQQLYEKKLADAGFRLDNLTNDLTQQPLPPSLEVDRLITKQDGYIPGSQVVTANIDQYLQMKSDKTTPQQKNRITPPSKADQLNRIIEKAFRAYNK